MGSTVVDERLSIQGNAVVDSTMLKILSLAAKRDGAEYQISELILAQLDPDGQHIICVRPQLIPDADLSNVNADGTGSTKLDITMGTPLPCEVLTKLAGQKAASKQMLSIIVKDYIKLQHLTVKDSPEQIFYAIDGQRRKNAGLN